MRVSSAENGQIAVDMVRLTRYDLILMDVQMPVLDGMAATEAIRRMPDRESVPILAMTANAFSEDRVRCLQAGMNDHIAKPLNVELLYESLVKYLPPHDPESWQRNEAPAPVAAPAPDMSHVDDIIMRLEALLAKNDTSANDFYEESRTLLTAALGEAALSIDRQIKNYDYADALTSLRMR